MDAGAPAVTREKRSRRHCLRMSVCLGDFLKEVTTKLVLEISGVGRGIRLYSSFFLSVRDKTHSVWPSGSLRTDISKREAVAT